MPRYFFHLTDGTIELTDSTGVELPGIASMRQHATEQIRKLSDAVPKHKIAIWSKWKIIAVDSTGNKVFEIGVCTPTNESNLHPSLCAKLPQASKL